jgi:hypothetical protein
MKKKKTYAVLLFLFITCALSAQVKYEFLVIQQNTYEHEIAVSMNGTLFKKEKIDYKIYIKSPENVSPLLDKLKAYQNEDWEVMNIETQLIGVYKNYSAVLRRKL